MHTTSLHSLSRTHATFLRPRMYFTVWCVCVCVCVCAVSGIYLAGTKHDNFSKEECERLKMPFVPFRDNYEGENEIVAHLKRAADQLIWVKDTWVAPKQEGMLLPDLMDPPYRYRRDPTAKPEQVRQCGARARGVPFVVIVCSANCCCWCLWVTTFFFFFLFFLPLSLFLSLSLSFSLVLPGWRVGKRLYACTWMGRGACASRAHDAVRLQVQYAYIAVCISPIYAQ